MRDYSGACTVWSFMRVVGFVWPVFLLYINEKSKIYLEGNRNGSEASLIFDVL